MQLVPHTLSPLCLGQSQTIVSRISQACLWLQDSQLLKNNLYQFELSSFAQLMFFGLRPVVLKVY